MVSAEPPDKMAEKATADNRVNFDIQDARPEWRKLGNAAGKSPPSESDCGTESRAKAKKEGVDNALIKFSCQGCQVAPNKLELRRYDHKAATRTYVNVRAQADKSSPTKGDATKKCRQLRTARLSEP